MVKLVTKKKRIQPQGFADGNRLLQNGWAGKN
jgi:hypothetical protein